MDLINVPRLRINKLQYLGESSLEICKDLLEISASVEKVKSALQDFLAGMLRDQASAAGKNDLDLIRDRLMSGFFKQVKAEQIYPHEDEAVIKTLQQLTLVTDKYGARIIRLPFDEESVAIDNLLTEVREIDLSPLTDNGITRWLDVIQKANNDFKAKSSEYISQSADVSSIQSASKQAPALIDALEGMYTMLYAHLKINPTDALKKAYAKLETLVGSLD